MLRISFSITVILILICIIVGIYEPRARTRDRINRFIEEDKDNKKSNKKQTKIKKPLRLKIRETFGAYIGKNISQDTESNTEKLLARAGNPLGLSVIDFQIFKVAALIATPALMCTYAKLLGISGGGVIGLTMLGILVGAIIPRNYISVKTKQRYAKAIKEMPDFIDLLTICLEAGLGFDSALKKVVDRKKGILGSEFHTCIEEIRLGKTRKESLNGVKDRLNFDEMKSFINGIIQAEKLGASMVSMLRVKSSEERKKRRQRAEEAAMKAPIKILFPLILFIFPSMFVVLIGPVIIQFIEQAGVF